ncbi:MAG: hypothetical protein IPJ19_11320 [Planctomycetes bacterium]|nr:hypothetical protein [Planctomycetota bacterium]
MSSTLEAPAARARVRASRALLLVFLACLAGPCAGRLLARVEPNLAEAELRRATEAPKWSWDSNAIQGYPRSYESYFADRLGLRSELLRWNSLQSIGIFGQFPGESMYIGREGFWFYADEHARDAWRGLYPFTRDELERWASELVAEAQWCRAHGMLFLVAVAPSKELIYPELVPERWSRVGPSRYDQLFERLEHSGVPLLDLRPAIEAEKLHDRPAERDFTYHPLGTHWTERASWAAYVAIERELAKSCPGFVPRARAQLAYERSELPGDTWAARAYVSDVYTQPYFSVAPQSGWRQTVTREPYRGRMTVRRHGPDPSRPRVVMLRDSFGFKVDELLAEDCSLLVQSHYVGFERHLIESVQPEVVIELLVDRKLNFPPGESEPGDEQKELAQAFQAAGPAARVLSLQRPPAQAALARGTKLELPPVSLDPERCAVVRVLLQTQSPGVLVLEGRLEASATGCPPRRIQIAFTAGTSQIFARLASRDLAAGARVSVLGGGTVSLRLVDARAESR